MEDNLFLQAMDPQEVVDINEIKLNKEFALRLISDLSKVFQTNHSVEDDKNYAQIRMKKVGTEANLLIFYYFNALFILSPSRSKRHPCIKSGNTSVSRSFFHTQLIS